MDAIYLQESPWSTARGSGTAAFQTSGLWQQSFKHGAASLMQLWAVCSPVHAGTSDYLPSTCHGVAFGDIVAMLIMGKPPLPASYGGHVWIPAAHWAVPAPHGLPFPASRWGSGPSHQLVGCFFSRLAPWCSAPFYSPSQQTRGMFWAPFHKPK